MPPKKKTAKKQPLKEEPKVKKKVNKNPENEDKEEEEEKEETIDPSLFKEFPDKIEYDIDEQPETPYQVTKVEVDELCFLKDRFLVYKKQKTYSTKMNKSSMVGGVNTNKYYIVQIVYEKDNINNFYLYKRWGRVGENGYQALIGPIKEQEAIEKFEERYIDRTVRSNYQEIHLQEDDNDQQQQQTQSNVSSTLSPKVQNLISLIFDVKIQKKILKEMGYDPAKCPLGKLAQSQIDEGYKVLNKISSALKIKSNTKMLEELSSTFFSLIPQDFGRSKMKDFIIDTENKVQEKLEMLQSLTDIKKSDDIANQKLDPNYHVLDAKYKGLNCDLKPLEENDEMFKRISSFIDYTKEGYQTDIQDIFEVTRPGENQRYFHDLKNDKLLWHGSRISNYGGILSQGLRIAPPEAPVSGYLYGKGIYLADMFDKSANYCRGGTDDNTILIMLIQTGLGKPRELHSTNCNAGDLPQGYHSTLGWGQRGPPESSYVQTKYGSLPQGKPQRTTSSTYMGHNEFIVYNVCQAQIKYLIRVKATR